MSGDLHVTIEELVLDGFEPGQALALAEAVRQTLERQLIDAPGALREDAEHVEAGTVRLGAGADPARAGSVIGRSLHAALTVGRPR